MFRWLLIAALPFLIAGSGAPAVPKPSAAPTSSEPKKLAAEHLLNPWQLHPKVIFGGLPEGDVAFKQLADLGVKTVISVDGAKPDVATGKRHGLRYVHLPHSYDGVPAERAEELAKAVRDLPGPIYIHCHHGKHRSPAAAAVACVGAGMLSPSRAVPFLKAAGTSESYKGLYESARAAHPFDRKILDDLRAEFPETVKVPPMAEAMVALEHTHDHLKLIAEAGWKAPPKHPALDPTHEALLLREHFTELQRTDVVKGQPEKFKRLLRASEADSQELEKALRASRAGGTAASLTAATKPFDRITANCKTCHATYRDVPLSEKARSAR